MSEPEMQWEFLIETHGGAPLSGTLVLTSLGREMARVHLNRDAAAHMVEALLEFLGAKPAWKPS